MKQKRLTLIDLFAGAGGLSLGFEQAGFRIEAAVEQDKWAAETLTFNHPNTRVFQKDITRISDEEITASFRPRTVDGVVGGPPCQGFSHSNVTKRDPHDPRNSLFREFARFVRLLRPAFFLMENVPGLLKMKLSTGRAAIDVITEEFDSLHYHVAFQMLRAESFGVPQIRERLFIVGCRDGRLSIPFPAPTHAKADDQITMFREPVLRKPTTLWEAISDLPPLEAGCGIDPTNYDKEPITEYQRELRGEAVRLHNHIAMRHSRRVVERFKQIPIGSSQSDVSDEYAPRVRSNGEKISQRRYDQNNRRLDPSRPSHTIPASFYANFVHPFQNRNFTPREGARIQSFPDRYVFLGKPTVVSQKLLSREGRINEKHLCQYVQIGNAVPPKLAQAIAENIRNQL